MAYNTRRSGGPPGMGRGTSQMMYQQRAPSMRSSPQSFGTPRINSMQSQQQGTFGHSQHQSQQNNGSNYSPQQPPQQQQQQNQQQQQQHQAAPLHPPPPQQQPPAIKVKEAPPTPPQKVPAPTPVPTPTPAPSTPMRTEPIPPPPPVEVKPDPDSEDGNESRPKPWLKKKVPGFKVNKKVKRRRQNARLRKILQPKNAIMVLNELKTGIKFTFQEHTNALTQTMFVVNAEVDGKTYTGQGLSKPLAKQNAAENALKDLLLQKMADGAMKVISEGADVPPEPMVTEVNNSVVADTDSMDGSEVGKPGAPEDDVPWGSLASFALYKLFTEWQSQGTHVPITKTPAASPTSQPVKPTAPAPMKKIPDNPTERHPVMLLNQLRPGVEFKEVSREGMPPNLVFTLSVTVDGATYTGVAKNKKDAKKEAAKSALAGSFNIHYD